MTVKTRIDQLEKAAKNAHRLAVVTVTRNETPGEAKARAGISPAFSGLLVIVDRFAGLN